MRNEYIPTVTQDGNPLPRIEDALEFFSSDLEVPPVLVEGLIHKGSKLVVGGGSKTMKTWTLLDLALSVATGKEWWGRKTTEGKVLYVNFEIQAAFFRERIQAILDARKVSLRNGEFDVWNLRGFAADADDLFPEMTAMVKGKNYALIVLDPIYKCLGKRDENKAGDIATLMNLLEKLAVESGAAVAFGAHFSKGNQSAKDSIDRIGGSGVFARDPDSIMVMTQHRQDNAFAVHPTLRNFKGVAPFCVRWDFPLMNLANDLDPADLRKPGSNSTKATPHPDEALMLFPKKWPAGEPRKGLLSAKQLAQLFDENGFDSDSVPEIRDALEKSADIRVLRNQEGNQTLAGRPDAVAAYEKWKARGAKTGGARREKR